MKHPNQEDSWESDDVWKLLDQAAPPSASPRFVDDVVRMAKLLPAPTPWWKRLLSPAPLAGLAGAAAAIALAVTLLNSPQPGSLTTEPIVAVAPQTDEFEALQDLAETETLIAAADHLDEFSDDELARLIGF